MRLTVQLDHKHGCARKEICFLCICATLIILMSIFKCSYTLDYIATLFQSPIYELHSLAVRAIQSKVVFLFSSWFAKEAKVANNNND